MTKSWSGPGKAPYTAGHGVISQRPTSRLATPRFIFSALNMARSSNAVPNLILSVSCNKSELFLNLNRRRSIMLIKEPSFVMIDGRRMAYAEVSPPHPRGTVLLLAGAGARKFSWYKQLDVFGRTFRTIALDYRDTGDSDPYPQSYTIAD